MSVLVTLLTPAGVTAYLTYAESESSVNCISRVELITWNHQVDPLSVKNSDCTMCDGWMDV